MDFNNREIHFELTSTDYTVSRVNLHLMIDDLSHQDLNVFIVLFTFETLIWELCMNLEVNSGLFTLNTGNYDAWLNNHVAFRVKVFFCDVFSCLMSFRKSTDR